MEITVKFGIFENEGAAGESPSAHTNSTHNKYYEKLCMGLSGCWQPQYLPAALAGGRVETDLVAVADQAQPSWAGRTWAGSLAARVS